MCDAIESLWTLILQVLVQCCWTIVILTSSLTPCPQLPWLVDISIQYTCLWVILLRHTHTLSHTQTDIQIYNIDRINPPCRSINNDKVQRTTYMDPLNLLTFTILKAWPSAERCHLRNRLRLNEFYYVLLRRYAAKYFCWIASTSRGHRTCHFRFKVTITLLIYWLISVCMCYICQ